MSAGADVAGNGDYAMGDGTAQAGAADPYDIGAGSQIGQDRDSDHDGLTDVFEKLADTSARLADTNADQVADAEEMSLGSDPLSADSDVDGVTDGPEISYQSDPLSDIHSGPWNQGLPGDVPGPQPDQGGVGGPHPSPGGLGGPHPSPGGLGGPEPDHVGVDPAGSDPLDTNAGLLDLN
jgi:hypothetical protein